MKIILRVVVGVIVTIVGLSIILTFSYWTGKIILSMLTIIAISTFEIIVVGGASLAMLFAIFGGCYLIGDKIID